MRYLSVDVECAATGRGHNDRAPCRIGAVDERGSVLLDVIVRVPMIYSPLEAVTGLTTKMIEEGVDFSVAVDELRRHLGPDVVLVGQAIDKDIDWLSLRRGVDYHDLVDIANSFRSWNERYGNWNYFSLRHEAYGLLGVTLGAGEAHDPTIDAKISMQLFVTFVKPGPETARAAANKLKHMRYTRQFPEVLLKRTCLIDGVCGAAFNPSECVCGQPTLRG